MSGSPFRAKTSRQITRDDILKRIPPQNLEAEQSVLGAILLDQKRALNTAFEIITCDDFYRETHREIARAMVALDEAHIEIDAITLTDALRNKGALEAVGGPAYIAEIASVVPTAANVAYYARIVHEKAILRSLASVATDIASTAYEYGGDLDEFLQDTAKRIFDICTEREQSGTFITMPEATRNYLKQIERAYNKENKENPSGLLTGFTDLDNAIGGLEPANLILIAARPSMGKTSLACGIACNVALAGGNVAFFSLEMNSSELVGRLLCSEARVDLLRAKRGFIGERDFPKLAQAAAALSETNIWIDDSAALTTIQLRSRCRRIINNSDKPLSLICVDYLQLMKPIKAHESREREVSEISRSLKELAKEFKVPVIALAQLSRQVEGRSDKRPMLADLRESGALENDADIVLFIYREEMYKRDCKEPGVAEINVAKQRNGPTGVEKLTWIGSYTRFENYAPDTGLFEDSRTPPE
jgi:replicative DNA helicase